MDEDKNQRFHYKTANKNPCDCGDNTDMQCAVNYVIGICCYVKFIIADKTVSLLQWIVMNVMQ